MGMKELIKMQEEIAIKTKEIIKELQKWEYIDNINEPETVMESIRQSWDKISEIDIDKSHIDIIIIPETKIVKVISGKTTLEIPMDIYDAENIAGEYRKHLTLIERRRYFNKLDSKETNLAIEITGLEQALFLLETENIDTEQYTNTHSNRIKVIIEKSIEELRAERKRIRYQLMNLKE